MRTQMSYICPNLHSGFEHLFDRDIFGKMNEIVKVAAAHDSIRWSLTDRKVLSEDGLESIQLIREHISRCAVRAHFGTSFRRRIMSCLGTMGEVEPVSRKVQKSFFQKRLSSQRLFFFIVLKRRWTAKLPNVMVRCSIK